MALSLFFASSTVKCATNAPNLVDRIKLEAQARGIVKGKASIPQFDVQQSSGVASTNVPNLVDRIVLRVASGVSVGTGQLAKLYGRLPESSRAAVLTNQYIGNIHRIVTPLTSPMMLTDVFIDSISWTGMVAAGHIMEIQDINGGLVSRCVSSQANDSNHSNLEVQQFVNGGYQVPTLDSGLLVVTLGPLSKNARGSGRG